MSFEEDNEFGDGQDASSEEEQDDQNEQDEDMEDADDGEEDRDAEEDEDGEGEGEGEGDGDGEEDGDGESDEDRDMTERSPRRTSATGKSIGPLTMPNSGSTSRDPLVLAPATPNQDGSPHIPQAEQDSSATLDSMNYLRVMPEYLTASVYDIVPTIAAPQSTSINAVTATPDMRWVFSGGTDGYIRKFNWVDTANGKLMLTVAQRHPFVDSVTKAGVLTSYWENDEPQAKSNDDGQAISPVYALAVQSQALWILAGVESGGINLQSVRHDEGKRIHFLKKHTSAVSVLQLAPDEKSVLSGSWDKTILDWDLNTGQIIRSFDGSGGQISAIELRPESSLPVPVADDTPPQTNGTFESNNASEPLTNGILADGTTNGVDDDADTMALPAENDVPQAQDSPAHSLSSLFGDNDADNDPNTGMPFDQNDDDELFSGAIPPADSATSPSAHVDVDIDIHMPDAQPDTLPITATNGTTSPSSQPQADSTELPATSAPSTHDPPIGTALSTAEPRSPRSPAPTDAPTDAPATSPTTFLSASIDGTLRLWDRRTAAPIARLVPQAPTPPWCTSACWAPDGRSLYVGRRNNTVEEYALHAPLRRPARTFRFPGGSGAVSAVRAMPNGRHLCAASYDILRLWDTTHENAAADPSSSRTGRVPFLIVPGHRTGVVSSLWLGGGGRWLVSAQGNRGWEGTGGQVLLGYEVGVL